MATGWRNKAQTSVTASVLFQDAYAGRAESGLATSNCLQVRVTADCAAWTTALSVSKTTGNVGLGVQPSALRLDMGAGDWRSGAAVFDRPAGSTSDVYFQHGGQGRWNVGVSPAGETGANMGSGSFLNRFSDAGTYLGTPFFIERASGELQFFIESRCFAFVRRPKTPTRWGLWARAGVRPGRRTAPSRPRTRATTEVAPIDGASAARVLDAVAPVTFRWIEGGRVVEEGADAGDADAAAAGPHPSRPRLGARRHAGLFSQEVRAALNAETPAIGTCGLSDRDDPESRQAPADQMVALLWAALWQTLAELAAAITASDTAGVRPD